MTDLAQAIREAHAHGCQVHVWPDDNGALAVVRGPHGCRHTRREHNDPVVALIAALTEDDRLRRDAPRAETAERDPRQLELPTDDTDDMEELLG